MIKLYDLLLIVITVLILLFAALLQDAKGSERAYQTAWCNNYNGVMEYQLSDRTRIDCLLPDYAIEVDFGKKWAESIGQSLYYALSTDTQPGIVLIMQSAKDCKYLGRLREVLSFGGLGITVWQVGDYAYSCSPINISHTK